MSEHALQISRRGLLKGAILAGAAGMLSSCDSDGEGSTESPAPTITETDTGLPSLPVEAYVENWLSGSDYFNFIDTVKPSDLQRLYIAFALPKAAGGIELDPLKPELGEFINSLDGASLALSIGGYGDDSAPKSSTRSRQSVLAGWKSALRDPAQFAASVTGARKQLANSLGWPLSRIDLDIDFEYPQASQRVAFNGLMQAVRAATDAHLSVALPSHYNLEGYDIPALAEQADVLNVMTYDNGKNYGPKEVVEDISRFADSLGGADKISVGYSTNGEKNPMIYTPADKLAIRRALDAAGIKPAAHFVWAVSGLNQDQIAALSR